MPQPEPDVNSMDSMCYSLTELQTLGIKTSGRNVRVDHSVRFFNPDRISLGENLRIDCFCVISAGDEGVFIGDNVHLATGCYIFGTGGRVFIDSFAGLSARVTIYTASDDYIEGHLTNPTIPDSFRKVRRGPVHVGRHAIIGAGSVILPGVTLEFGASVGALTVIRKNVPECSIVYGNPLKTLPQRRDGARLRQLESEYRALGIDETQD